MTLLKYTGNGLISRNIHFTKETNDGLFEVSKENADYFLKTFPKDFTIIETTINSTEKEPTKKPTRRRKKKVEISPEPDNNEG